MCGLGVFVGDVFLCVWCVCYCMYISGVCGVCIVCMCMYGESVWCVYSE